MIKAEATLVGWAAAAMALMASCADDNGEVFAIGASEYQFPERALVSSSRSPHVFVRVQRPERSYSLIHDSRLQGQRDATGWPIIFSINDEAGAQLQRLNTAAGPVICRSAVAPKGGCGLLLQQAGAEWQVLFPEAQLEQAEMHRRAALRDLHDYRAGRR